MRNEAIDARITYSDSGGPAHAKPADSGPDKVTGLLTDAISNTGHPAFVEPKYT